MLQKQPISINFAAGLDTKTDSNQVSIGKFLALQNSVFDTLGRLTKRNGYGLLTTIETSPNLPVTTNTTLTTLNDNLIATGSNLYAYSEDTNQWLNQGVIQPIQLSVLPLVRVSTSQSNQDSATASNGLVCTAYVDSSQAYYQISDGVTGQQIVKRTALPSTAANPRTFVLGVYFIVTYVATVSGAPQLQAVAIPFNDPIATPTTITIGAVVASLTAAYDAVTVQNQLYVAWAQTSSRVSAAYVTNSLSVSNSINAYAGLGSLISFSGDNNNNSWLTVWDSSANLIETIFYGANLALKGSASYSTTGLTLTNLTASPSIVLYSASGQAVGPYSLTVFYEISNTYPYTPAVQNYPSTVATDYIQTVTASFNGSSVSIAAPASSTGIVRSVGLASKAFTASNGTIYVLATYGEPSQPTYFLIDSSGNVYMRLAYSNGGGLYTGGVLPSVSYVNGQYQVSYLYKDFLTTINKGSTILSSGTPVVQTAIYSQTGINLASFGINDSGQYSSEIASALYLTGGQIWEYDGVRPVEFGFQVWPETIGATWSASGGQMAAIPVSGGSNADAYYYQFTYEWTDNAGNLHRSAPSIPVAVTTTGSGSSGSVTLEVPTLRLTYKVSPNPVRIVGYRWSQGQQVYYQFTSVTSPQLNSTTVDYVTITDTLADSSILGNAVLYTTGGTVEDIAAPASIASCLFKNRLFLVDAEDQNLLWYSKQVIEAVPVEMSDLFTLYVAPTTGTQGSTGPCTALSAMDDKLIIFKRNAAYYITGTGPDNTGANNDFSDPIFITSSVGCANPNSIVLMQNGLMFQSAGKGIWLLGRDLSTQYIGAPVEAYNSHTVLSANSIPGTNQIRFILDNGITLMYDYYMQQWGTFNNTNAISSTLQNNLHTYLNASGLVFQETPGTYLDGSTPVLLSFTTSWISAAGLQGWERFYEMFLLGNYFTPFKLNVQMAYDYNSSQTQSVIVSPDNFSGAWGSQTAWGTPGGWGGAGQPFEARVFPQKQKCETFQITVNELYDPSLGAPAGQGVALSGLNLIVGVKKGYRNQKASRSFG